MPPSFWLPRLTLSFANYVYATSFFRRTLQVALSNELVNLPQVSKICCKSLFQNRDRNSHNALFLLKNLQCHSSSALWASLIIAGRSQLMRCSFTTVGADTITARACRKTASLAPATTALTSTGAASTHSSACSGSLTPWPCSVSSWHFIHHLFNNLTF